mmetsp:Transcript_38400/g.123479  ORF Transcript_38400/g.123479 Transcript_38400/m.123479 type:complete len:275 (-) Transcript_38400:56-880(-)
MPVQTMESMPLGSTSGARRPSSSTAAASSAAAGSPPMASGRRRRPRPRAWWAAVAGSLNGAPAKAQTVSKCTADLSAALDQFLASASMESPASRTTWGNKIGHHVMDEEEVLSWPGAAVGLDSEPPRRLPVLAFPRPQGSFPDALQPPNDHWPFFDALIVDMQNARPEGPNCRAIGFAQRRCLMETVQQVSADDDKCPICMDAIVRDQEAWRLPCFHRVHGACAAAYYGVRMVQPLCPLCRFDLRTKPEAHTGEEGIREPLLVAVRSLVGELPS